METFSALLALCEGNHRSVDSPHNGQWRRHLMFIWSAPEQTVAQTIQTPAIWDAMALFMASLYWAYFAVISYMQIFLYPFELFHWYWEIVHASPGVFDATLNNMSKWIAHINVNGTYNDNDPNALEWHHNERDSVFNHRCLDCLLNRLLRLISKKTSKLRVTGLCDRWPMIPHIKGL